jgi:hypothetical protein
MKTKRWIAASVLLAVGTSACAADAVRDNTTLAAKAEAVFGKQAGQSFDAQAVKPSAAPLRTETVTVTLAPGKGAEVQAELDVGQGMVSGRTRRRSTPATTSRPASARAPAPSWRHSPVNMAGSGKTAASSRSR